MFHLTLSAEWLPVIIFVGYSVKRDSKVTFHMTLFFFLFYGFLLECRALCPRTSQWFTPAYLSIDRLTPSWDLICYPRALDWLGWRCEQTSLGSLAILVRSYLFPQEDIAHTYLIRNSGTLEEFSQLCTPILTLAPHPLKLSHLTSFTQLYIKPAIPLYYPQPRTLQTSNFLNFWYVYELIHKSRRHHLTVHQYS